jgi:hypothetical protein
VRGVVSKSSASGWHGYKSYYSGTLLLRPPQRAVLKAGWSLIRGFIWYKNRRKKQVLGKRGLFENVETVFKEGFHCIKGLKVILLGHWKGSFNVARVLLVYQG